MRSLRSSLSVRTRIFLLSSLELELLRDGENGDDGAVEEWLRLCIVRLVREVVWVPSVSANVSC